MLLDLNYDPNSAYRLIRALAGGIESLTVTILMWLNVDKRLEVRVLEWHDIVPHLRLHDMFIAKTL